MMHWPSVASLSALALILSPPAACSEAQVALICRAVTTNVVTRASGDVDCRIAAVGALQDLEIRQALAPADLSQAQLPADSLADTTATPADSLADAGSTPPTPPVLGTARPTPMEPSASLAGLLRRDYTDRILLPLGLTAGEGSVSQESAWRALVSRLRQAGYDDVSVYSLDSTGFAVVCPVEHIEKNGKRKQPEWGWTLSKRGWRGALLSIVVPQTELYRVLLLITPSAPAAADSTLPDTDYADRLASGGQLYLPTTNAGRTLLGAHCELRVYEFFRRNENAAPEFVKKPHTRARGHAERSGLWSREELR